MKKLLALLILLAAPSAHAVIVREHNVVRVTSMSFTITQPTAGNTLILLGRINGGNFTSVTGGGCTWQELGYSSATRTAYAACCPNSSGVGTTIVVSTNAGAAPEINFTEWSGTDGCNLDGVFTRASGTGVAVSVGTMTITNAGSLVIGKASWAGNASTTLGPTHGFTDLGFGDTGILGKQAFLLPAATGSYTTGWTINASNTWDGIIFALAPAVAGGGGSGSTGGNTTSRNLFWWFY
jgi:hypothetical protein